MLGVLSSCKKSYATVKKDGFKMSLMGHGNFLIILTNSLSDIPSKFRSCFYVFRTMFLTVNFLHPTEILIQCPFRQAWILFFGSWCFCII